MVFLSSFFSSYKAWLNTFLDLVHTSCFRHAVTRFLALELFLESRQVQEEKLVFAACWKNVVPAFLGTGRAVHEGCPFIYFLPLCHLFSVPSEKSWKG